MKKQEIECYPIIPYLDSSNLGVMLYYDYIYKNNKKFKDKNK